MPLPVKVGTDQTIAHAGDPLVDDRPESAPWVTALANGRFQVSYSHLFSAGGGDLDLYYQGFEDFDGTHQQVRTQTEIVTSGLIEDQATTVRLADGRVVVAWHRASTAGPGDADDVRATVMYPDGTVDIANIDVSSGTGKQKQPAVAASADGGFAVACTDDSVANNRILVKIYNAAGAQIAAPVITPADGVFVDTSFSDTRDVSIVGLSNGNYVVCWAKPAGEGIDGGVRAQIISASGALVGSELEFASFFPVQPTLTATEDGGFFVGWLDGAVNVAGAFCSDDGTDLRSFEFTTEFSPDFASQSLSAATLPDGRIVMVWAGGSNAGGPNDGDVFGRIVNPDGSFDSDIFTVNSDTGGLQGDAQVEVLADGRFVVTWETAANGGKVQYTVYDPRVAGVELAGTAGDDVYQGSAFADVMIGQAGDDRLAGAGGSDQLFGGFGRDDLRGGDGSDTLDGGGEVDFMAGGDGSDTYFANLLSDVVGETNAVLATGGNDLVYYSGAAGFFVLGDNVERLTLTGTGASGGVGNGLGNTLTGNVAANTHFGLDGNDTLVGGGGADVLVGGSNNDTYVVDLADTITEAAGTAAGTADLILWTGLVNQTYLIKTNVENLTLTGAAATRGTGNTGNNIMSGNAGANILDGGVGNDTLKGLAGNDTLIGNAGKDAMTGGLNNDVFRFLNKAHSPVGAGADVITDFDKSGDDRIDVSTLFGPAMSYRHNLGFTAAGQVRINDIAGVDLLVEVNTGGTLAADMQVRLTATTLASMTASDFIL